MAALRWTRTDTRPPRQAMMRRPCQRDRDGGKCRIYKDGRDEFRCRLKSRNGEIAARVECYPTKAAAKKGIKAVQTAAANANANATIDDMTE